MQLTVITTPLMTANLMVALARTTEPTRIDAILAEPTPDQNPVGQARTMRDIVRDMIAMA